MMLLDVTNYRSTLFCLSLVSRERAYSSHTCTGRDHMLSLRTTVARELIETGCSLFIQGITCFRRFSTVNSRLVDKRLGPILLQ
jgi:hypothetical protein